MRPQIIKYYRLNEELQHSNKLDFFGPHRLETNIFRTNGGIIIKFQMVAKFILWNDFITIQNGVRQDRFFFTVGRDPDQAKLILRSKVHSWLQNHPLKILIQISEEEIYALEYNLI